LENIEEMYSIDKQAYIQNLNKDQEVDILEEFELNFEYYMLL
jgi:hypothetical protein